MSSLMKMKLARRFQGFHRCSPGDNWLLHLAGDWKDDMAERGITHHRMRVMLNANIHVEQRFANGTQGRLLWWRPRDVLGGKPLPASDPELIVRFAKESSHGKRHTFPNIDFIDVECRRLGVSDGESIRASWRRECRRAPTGVGCR